MISIVVPVYKVRDYLPGCLDSILANDTSDCEIILVDDGSPDDSGAICDRYAQAHPDLIRVIHQDNGGLGAARNTGVANAKGEWLFFIDSDDTIAPESLGVLKEAIRLGGAQVIGFQFCADDGVNPPRPQSCGFDAAASPFRLSDRKDYLLSLPSAWLRLWHRSLFTESGVLFPSRVWYEDIRTTAKLLPLADGIRVLPDHLYNYLTRQGSIMNNRNLDRNREILEALDDVLNWYRRQNLFDAYRDELCAMTVENVLLAASVRVARVDPKSPLLREFADYTAKTFPDWKQNPYRKRLTRAKRLALALVEHRRYRILKQLFAMKG
jgi:glycosyltransferase involved in cell wall biosynthesis